ncbi:uncharacterized protein [Nicotiana sylvestris]|uniref:uncharacterized protein n=1 Tax=Nicotiana sylvestris TaxID=4096 RepID=UPI00388C59D4
MIHPFVVPVADGNIMYRKDYVANTDASSGGCCQASPGIDYNHSLFLYLYDMSVIHIITFQLIGIENYSIWFRSMRHSLLRRNKLGLVDGSYKKENFSEAMGNHWERVNAIVLSWIMSSAAKGLLGGIMYATNKQTVWEELHELFNKIDGSRTFNVHKEIATLTQGTAYVSSYFSKLKDLWGKFEALVLAPNCNCEKSNDFRLHLQKLKLFQFLMGLNDSYAQAIIQILLMCPMPSANQAYSMIISDESQKLVKNATGIIGVNPAVMLGNYEAAMFTRNVGGNHNYKFKKNYNLECEVQNQGTY